MSLQKTKLWRTVERLISFCLIALTCVCFSLFRSLLPVHSSKCDHEMRTFFSAFGALYYEIINILNWTTGIETKFMSHARCYRKLNVWFICNRLCRAENFTSWKWKLEKNCRFLQFIFIDKKLMTCLILLQIFFSLCFIFLLLFFIEMLRIIFHFLTRLLISK
jgi:hypothetical protein